MYFYAVKYLVALLKPSQYGNGVLHGRLVNLYGLETPFQSGILFYIFAVLVKGGRADTVKFTSGKHWL